MVLFYTHEAKAITVTNSPLFIEAAALAMPHQNAAQERFLLEKTYSVSPTEEVHTPVGDHRRFRVLR